MPRALASRRRAVSALGLLLQITLITVGVFLGLLADEWREGRQERALADSTLQRFRVEVAANREAVQAVLTYHRDLRDRVSLFIESSSPKSFQAFMTQTQFGGIRPVIFEESAWDIAVATGSLGYIDSELAFEISRTYTAQTKLELMQQTFAQSSLAPATFAAPDLTGLGITMAAYLTDVTRQEPQILEHYAALTAALDDAVGPAAPSDSVD